MKGIPGAMTGGGGGSNWLAQLFGGGGMQQQPPPMPQMPPQAPMPTPRPMPTPMPMPQGVPWQGMPSQSQSMPWGSGGDQLPAWMSSFMQTPLRAPVSQPYQPPVFNMPNWPPPPPVVSPAAPQTGLLDDEPFYGDGTGDGFGPPRRSSFRSGADYGGYGGMDSGSGWGGGGGGRGDFSGIY
jgi:hypothetical protein